MNDERRLLIEREFRQWFGHEPTVWASAPGRVDLMGSHTDYNHGFVLTMAIGRDTIIAARPRNDARVDMRSFDLPGAAHFDLEAITYDRLAPWSNYVRGVAKVLQDEGYALRGFDGLIHSTVPLSSGLSSSAALEVATARLCDHLSGLGLDPVDLAVLCQRAENQFVGMNCGILDQYTSSVCPPGSALLLDCRHLTSDIVSLPPDIRVVICDTRAKRELTGSEYPERRAACEQGAALLAARLSGVTHLRDVTLSQFEAFEEILPAVVAKRCRFILEENARVLALSHALPLGDRAAIRQLSQSSFVGAGKLYEIVTPEMEAMMAAMLSAPGIIGARQAGAGFGGCMVAFVEADQADAFADVVRAVYGATTGIEARVFEEAL